MPTDPAAQHQALMLITIRATEGLALYVHKESVKQCSPSNHREHFALFTHCMLSAAGMLAAMVAGLTKRSVDELVQTQVTPMAHIYRQSADQYGWELFGLKPRKTDQDE